MKTTAARIQELHNEGKSNRWIAEHIMGISESDVRAVLRHNAEHPPELDMNQPSEKPKKKKDVKKATKKVIRPEYYVDASGKHRWRLKSRNGELFGAAHQGFTTKQEAQKNFARNRRLEE